MLHFKFMNLSALAVCDIILWHFSIFLLCICVLITLLSMFFYVLDKYHTLERLVSVKVSRVEEIKNIVYKNIIIFRKIIYNTIL